MRFRAGPDDAPEGSYHTIDGAIASLGEVRPFRSNLEPSLLLARVDGLLCSRVSFFCPFFAYFS